MRGIDADDKSVIGTLVGSLNVRLSQQTAKPSIFQAFLRGFRKDFASDEVRENLEWSKSAMT